MGLYVVLPSAAQADLDRLRGETSHCEALFAYSTDQKNISSVFTRGHHLSNMFRVPQLYYLLRQAVYRTHAMIDVYIRLWRTRNTTEGRIYTPVAVDVLMKITVLLSFIIRHLLHNHRNHCTVNTVRWKYAVPHGYVSVNER